MFPSVKLFVAVLLIVVVLNWTSLPVLGRPTSQDRLQNSRRRVTNHDLPTLHRTNKDKLEDKDGVRHRRQTYGDETGRKKRSESSLAERELNDDVFERGDENWPNVTIIREDVRVVIDSNGESGRTIGLATNVDTPARSKRSGKRTGKATRRRKEEKLELGVKKRRRKKDNKVHEKSRALTSSRRSRKEDSTSSQKRVKAKQEKQKKRNLGDDKNYAKRRSNKHYHRSSRRTNKKDKRSRISKVKEKQKKRNLKGRRDTDKRDYEKHNAKKNNVRHKDKELQEKSREVVKGKRSEKEKRKSNSDRSTDSDKNNGKRRTKKTYDRVTQEDSFQKREDIDEQRVKKQKDRDRSKRKPVEISHVGLKQSEGREEDSVKRADLGGDKTKESSEVGVREADDLEMYFFKKDIDDYFRQEDEELNVRRKRSLSQDIDPNNARTQHKHASGLETDIGAVRPAAEEKSIPDWLSDSRGKTSSTFLTYIVPPTEERKDSISKHIQQFSNNPEETVLWEEPVMLANCWIQMMLAAPYSFTPSCNADGTFSGKQCYLERCWCVDYKGKPTQTNPKKRFYYQKSGLRLTCSSPEVPTSEIPTLKPRQRQHAVKSPLLSSKHDDDEVPVISESAAAAVNIPIHFRFYDKLKLVAKQ